MAVVVCVGCLDDESGTPVRGNGKGITITYYALQEWNENPDRTIISNYHLFNVPYKYMTAQEIYNAFQKGELPEGSILLLDEISKFLNSLGMKQKVLTGFVNGFISQIRKLDADFYGASQRWMDVPKRFRAQTDRVLIPIKIHDDNQVCLLDRCKKHHFIEVYSHKPYREHPLVTLDTSIIGKYYDTKEVIYDELTC
jgi:hypothetical protein